MDVAFLHELNTKAQWELLRGFGLQLRDTYGSALCVSLHPPNTKGDHRNVHGHIFMTTRAVDADGNFQRRRFALSTTANLAVSKSSESETCGNCVAIALSEKPGCPRK